LPESWFYGNIPSMKTTMELPDDLMREVKIRAAREGKKLREIVERALRNDLNAASQPAVARPLPSGVTIHPTLGFPMIECDPNSKISTMSAEDWVQLEQDIILKEDLQRAGITL
jgi:plasmid stability protein